MKRTWILLSVAVLGLAGCQQPQEVALTPDPETAGIDVEPIVTPDSGLVTVGSDSASALLPADHVQYRGLMTVSHVKLDAGRGVTSFALSAVFLGDSTIQHMGRTVGYRGMNLGTVTINNDTMIALAHRILIHRSSGRDSVLLRGWEYLANLTGVYRPAVPYTWKMSASGFADVTIGAPADLVVYSPAGGAIVSRRKDLELRWSGGGKPPLILISAYDPTARTSKPLVQIRPRSNTGRAYVPSGLLRELPQAQRFFVFTFILANRLEGVTLGQYAGPVLVQAASVYGSVVELR